MDRLVFGNPICGCAVVSRGFASSAQTRRLPGHGKGAAIRGPGMASCRVWLARRPSLYLFAKVQEQLSCYPQGKKRPMQTSRSSRIGRAEADHHTHEYTTVYDTRTNTSAAASIKRTVEHAHRRVSVPPDGTHLYLRTHCTRAARSHFHSARRGIYRLIGRLRLCRWIGTKPYARTRLQCLWGGAGTRVSIVPADQRESCNGGIPSVANLNQSNRSVASKKGRKASEQGYERALGSGRGDCHVSAHRGISRNSRRHPIGRLTTVIPKASSV